MQCFRNEAPEETSHFDEERAKAAFFGAVSGKLGEDGSRRLAQALTDAVEERPSAGNAGEDGNPLHLLSAKRRWAIRDGDLPLAESIAAAVAQTLEALEGSPSSLFSAAATIFLLARHVRSRGCRLTADETSALVCLKNAKAGISAHRLASRLGWPEGKAAEVLAGLEKAHLGDGSLASLVARDRRGNWRPLV